MEQGRERIENFLRRFGYEENRVVRVLAVAVAILLALLLALRALRILRVLTVPVVIGAILVVGWLLLGSLTIPRLTSAGPVVQNGVVAIVACGEKRGLKGMDAAMHYVPEPRTGGWWPEKKSQCTIWYHRPPDWHQRIAHHQRANEGD